MTVSNPERVQSGDTARMYRLSRGAVRMRGSSMFEMPGTATPQYRDSRGHWILGDHVGPLALIGKRDDLINFVQKHGDDIVRNDSDPDYEMTAIGVAVSRSMYGNEVTSKDVRSLDPVGDTTVALVRGLSSFVPASGAAEFLMGIADLVDAGETMQVRNSGTRHAGDTLQITFFVAPDGAGTATNELDFSVDGRPARGIPLSKFANGIADGLTAIA
jgi:hypothetical protein